MLRDYQTSALRDCRNAYSSGASGVLLVAPTGAGKCLGIGTPVIMADGSVVAVESIRPGDVLLAPDGAARTVTSTCRGTDEMFRIIPTKGMSWTCNAPHVLTLVSILDNSTIDVSLSDWMGWSKYRKHTHKLFHAKQISFHRETTQTIDPYFLGLWYGDGTKALNGVAITKPDPEVAAACASTAAAWGCFVRVHENGAPGDNPTFHLATPRGRPNALLRELRRVTRSCESGWPDDYVYAPPQVRLEFLAGLLDSDGHLSRKGFEFVQKNRSIADMCAFVARSVGLCVTESDKVVNGVSYRRLYVSGNTDMIPNRIPRKQAGKRLQIKDALRTGFTVEPIGRGEYAGFTITGDGRFLLGDFTVTHNTVIAAAVVSGAAAKGRSVLVVAPRREIVAQTSAKLHAAGVRHGIIAAGRKQPDAQAPVQLGMSQTIRRRLGTMAAPDLIIIDEAHLDEYADIVERFPNARRLLLTATPLRASRQGWRPLADTLVEVSSVPRLVAEGYLVEPHVWSAEQPDLSGVRRGVGGEYAPGEAGARYQRAAILGDTVEQWRRHCSGRPTLVFASSVEHSKALRDALRAAGARAEHIDGTTPADERERILAALAAGSLDVVCNYGVLCEGLDIPVVSAAIIARSTQSESLWRQMVGRALRPAAGKTAAIIIDQGGNAYRHGHPMAERVWSLDGIDRAGRLDPDGDPDAPPSCRTCAECHAIYPATETVCPRCGAEPEVVARKPPRALTRVELALLRPDGTPAPRIEVDGKLVAPRPLPAGVSEVWRPAWEQVELQRIAQGRHWRWSLHSLRAMGAPVVVPPAFGR